MLDQDSATIPAIEPTQIDRKPASVSV